MRRIAQLTTALAVAVGTLAVGVAAQTTTPVHAGTGGSPHVKSAWVIDGAKISIEYGRPSLKGRAEGTLMPAGEPWRTGADEATVLTTDKPLRFGALTLAAGTHTINTQPGTPTWQFIAGTLSKPGQWGVPYNAALEKGRAPMQLGKTAAPVEMLTISIDDTTAGATLRIEWGTVRATIPFTVG